MKKINLKSTLAMVAVAASCLGAWKAYDTYEEAKKYKEPQCECWEKNIIPSTWSPHLGCWKKE